MTTAISEPGAPAVQYIAFVKTCELKGKGERKWRNRLVCSTHPFFVATASSQSAPIISDSGNGLVWRSFDDRLYRQLMIEDRPMTREDLEQCPSHLPRKTEPEATDYPYFRSLTSSARAQLDSTLILKSTARTKSTDEREAIARVQAYVDTILIVDGVVHRKTIPPMLGVSLESASAVRLAVVPRWHNIVGRLAPTIFFTLDEVEQARDFANTLAQSLNDGQEFVVRDDIEALHIEGRERLSAPSFQVDWRHILLSTLKPAAVFSTQQQAYPGLWAWREFLAILPPEGTDICDYRYVADIDLLFRAFLALTPALPQTSECGKIGTLGNMARARLGTAPSDIDHIYADLQKPCPINPRPEDVLMLIKHSRAEIETHASRTANVSRGSGHRWADIMRLCEIWDELHPETPKANNVANVILTLLALLPASERQASNHIEGPPQVAVSILKGEPLFLVDDGLSGLAL